MSGCIELWRTKFTSFVVLNQEDKCRREGEKSRTPQTQIKTTEQNTRGSGLGESGAVGPSFTHTAPSLSHPRTMQEHLGWFVSQHLVRGLFFFNMQSCCLWPALLPELWAKYYSSMRTVEIHSVRFTSLSFTRWFPTFTDSWRHYDITSFWWH